MKFRMQQGWRWLGVLGAVFVPAIVMGALELPFTFQSGSAIKASEVNANFEALAAKFDALSGGSLSAPVGTLTLATVVTDVPIRKFSQSIDVAWTPGQPSGKPQFSQIVIERDSGEGSPVIDHTISMGKVLTSASIVLGNLTIDLTKVNVMGVSMATPRGAQAQEAVSLSFGSITYTWTEPNKPVRSMTYDLATNVGGSGVTQAFTYGYFPAGVAPDAAYVPISNFAHQIVTPSAGAKPQFGALSVVKPVGVDTLDALGLLVTSKVGSTVDVDFFADATTINNGVQLEGVVVTGVALSTDASGALSEKTAFGYQTINWTAGNVSQGWDVIAGKSL
jgi:type VI protein secretion system component Hcp